MNLRKRHKNLKAVQNGTDGITSTAIQLVINRVQKRRDLFAELLPKFQEYIEMEVPEVYKPCSLKFIELFLGSLHLCAWRAI